MSDPADRIAEAVEAVIRTLEGWPFGGEDLETVEHATESLHRIRRKLASSGEPCGGTERTCPRCKRWEWDCDCPEWTARREQAPATESDEPCDDCGGSGKSFDHFENGEPGPPCPAGCVAGEDGVYRIHAPATDAEDAAREFAEARFTSYDDAEDERVREMLGRCRSRWVERLTTELTTLLTTHTAPLRAEVERLRKQSAALHEENERVKCETWASGEYQAAAAETERLERELDYLRTKWERKTGQSEMWDDLQDERRLFALACAKQAEAEQQRDEAEQKGRAAGLEEAAKVLDARIVQLGEGVPPLKNLAGLHKAVLDMCAEDAAAIRGLGGEEG